MNKKFHKIHMIGIGGAGMSGIAEILLQQGYSVSGSDMARSAVTERLETLGARVTYGHGADNVGDVQVVIKSSAINDDNPEIMEAKRRKIAIIPRAEMLAELMRLKNGVAVAGTHGKTTTTSLAAAIFDAANYDPTVIIGGRLNVYGSNARLGEGKFLIAEADESDGSFLCLFPIINIITNIDEDHLDYYGDREAIDQAFLQFMNKAPFYGLNVVCGDDPGIKKLLRLVKRPLFTYGFDEGNDLRAVILNRGYDNHFEVYKRGEKLGEIHLPQPGRHNVLNALAAIGASLYADISFSDCARGLAGFRGVGRRFEKKGERKGVTVIDDYGHHPAEIQATIACAREVFPGRRLVAAFQPHRFTRTRDHFGDFCKLFDMVDELLLTEIYAASEKPIPGVSGQNLALGIRQISKTPVHYFENLESLQDGLEGILKPGDVLLTLGAGSITKVGPSWLNGGANA